MKAWKKVLGVVLSSAMVITSVPAVTFGAEGEGEDSNNGYTEVFFDDFTGSQLDRSVWNVETHEAGWVNEELQEYVDSTDNIFLNDGKLVIQPIKDSDGRITSGRISTQNKLTFTYGKFEVRAKVPSGKGYLPAFWLMSNDENVYGQWPRCGEIDCMEVMGQETNKLYGTIHYGNPHGQKQGEYVITDGPDFAEDFHTYTCEWEPGKITWFVDGEKYYETSDWYSRTEGQGELTYPAPFDQPFYMILNLAVGGSWVGYPEDDAVIDQPFIVDYVKVFQKDSYNEDVEKPVVEEHYREADANGNYIHNGNFAIAENLSDDTDWKFLEALGGVANATISGNEMTIATTDAGTVDYSVQLVQPELPMFKGATYKVTFDAYADAARTMVVDVSAPDRGYVRYLSDTKLNLTTEKQSYSYEFTMNNDTDANGRLEFNLGNQNSTATVYISNVKVEKIKDADPEELNKKTVLADGNYIYNGKFQEGAHHMGNWEIAIKDNNVLLADTGVSSFADGRRLVVNVSSLSNALSDVKLIQKDIPVIENKIYAFSFDAQADREKEIKINVLGKEETITIGTENKNYKISLPATASYDNRDLVMELGTEGKVCIDNVRLVEDVLIKNGSFDAGITGYEVYVDSSADASYVVDSLTEDNALDLTIKNTSDQDWKIQVKQNNVPLVKGKWYKLSFKAKSDMEREIRVIMQGKESRGWDVYSNDNVVTLSSEYKTFVDKFQMTKDTDLEAFLSICLGKVTDTISTQHRVVIDNISLTEIKAPVPADKNLFKNPEFKEGMENWSETIANWGGDYVTEASSSIADGVITYNIVNPGTDEWHVQLKQSNLNLVEGEKYKVSMNISTSVARSFKTCVMSTSYAWYGGTGEPYALAAGTENHVEFEFVMSKDDEAADFVISLGKMPNEATPGSVVSISDLTFTVVKDEVPSQPDGPENPEEPDEIPVIEGNMLSNNDFSDGLTGWSSSVFADGGATATTTVEDGVLTYNITNPGTAEWHIQLKQSNLALKEGQQYTVTMDVTTTATRVMNSCVMSKSYAWYGGVGDNYVIEAGKVNKVSYSFTMEKDDRAADFVISLGKMGDTPASIVKISNITLKATQAATSGEDGEQSDDDDKKPVEDDKKPVEDDKKPVEDDKKPVEDEEKKPVEDDDKKPVEDDDQKTVEDDKDKVTTDDNTESLEQEKIILNEERGDENQDDDTASNPKMGDTRTTSILVVILTGCAMVVAAVFSRKKRRM